MIKSSPVVETVPVFMLIKEQTALNEVIVVESAYTVKKASALNVLQRKSLQMMIFLFVKEVRTSRTFLPILFKYLTSKVVLQNPTSILLIHVTFEQLL